MFLVYVLTTRVKYEEIEHCSALSGTDCKIVFQSVQIKHQELSALLQEMDLNCMFNQQGFFFVHWPLLPDKTERSLMNCASGGWQVVLNIKLVGK